MPENIFADEWQECLRAHYMHVIRTHDRVTLPSLTVVMHQAGYTDAQLAELRVRATMRVEDAPPDFVPDLDALNPTQDAAPAGEAHIFAVLESPPSAPSPDTVSENAAEDASAKDEPLAASHEVQPALAEAALSEEQLAELEAERLSGKEIDGEEEKDEPDAPQQLSLF